jgi:hypothetical protein
MRFMPLSRVVAAGVIGLLVAIAMPASACLRDALDDRAVEWSTLIVQAKLTAVHDPQTIASITTRPSGAASSAGSIQFQTYDFEVTSNIDGQSNPGDSIHVIRFIIDTDTAKSSICGQAFTPRMVGKSFFLLLIPESNLRWSDREKGPDPRTPELHALNAFMVVHLELASDLGSDGIDDAKYTVTSTRAAEAQFKADDAKIQVQTLVNAQDDTEESQAEHAILEMGPKAIPTLKTFMSQLDEEGQARVQKVIRQLSPPSILGSIHEH